MKGVSYFLQLNQFLDLNSKYTTQWYGPWIGFDFETRVERCAFIFGGIEYHQFAYRGQGRWNLRPDIGRFSHIMLTEWGTMGAWRKVGNMEQLVYRDRRHISKLPNRKGHENQLLTYCRSKAHACTV